MAGQLNGGGPHPGALRVTFAPGSAGSAGARGSAGTTGSACTTGSAAGSGDEAAVIDPGEDGTVDVDGKKVLATLERFDGPRASLRTPAGTRDVLVAPLPDARRAAAGLERVEVVIDGWRFELDVEPERRALLRERATNARGDAARGGPVELRAIIPGRVVSVDVAEGDTVETGARLLVLEAMKMQNELRATRPGTIGRLLVGVGQTIELGELLLVIE
jgi:biotin carboxyl carrier protein